MSNPGKGTVWATSRGDVVLRVEAADGKWMESKMTADNAEELAHGILREVAWVRERVG